MLRKKYMFALLILLLLIVVWGESNPSLGQMYHESSSTNWANIFIGILIGVFGFITLILGLFKVEQQTTKVIERFGRFHKLARPGLNFKMPWIDTVAGQLSLRIQQLEVKVDTKTHDNVFVRITVAVQYRVQEEKAFDAFYKLEDVRQQINSFVFDSVRSKVPTMKLDEVFEKKDDIAIAVNSDLRTFMDEFGHSIVKALVTDIEPDAKVKDAMNEINAAERLRIAAQEKGEAEKILKVKQAEADMESKRLEGEGISEQRKAIVKGFKEAVEDTAKALNINTDEVMYMILITQFFDTLRYLGDSKSNTILVPYNIAGFEAFSKEILNAQLIGKVIKEK